MMASGSTNSLRFVLVLGGALALSGCDGVELPAFLAGGGDSPPASSNATRSVERDVEAPDVFQVSDRGLWDGRPSLGGVWVAHPDVREPERVIIRNSSNSQFVIGVVYRPERTSSGPKFQVSSDAADALGMLAGQPADLSVTALRRAETPEPEADAEAGTPVVETAALDPIAAASQALDDAETGPSIDAAAIMPSTSTAPVSGPVPGPVPGPTPAPVPASSLDRPYLQIGIFSVQSNANGTANQLRQSGMVPTVKEGTMSGKAFWRVVVGPASNASERTALLNKIKGLGFSDAYPVTN